MRNESEEDNTEKVEQSLEQMTEHNEMQKQTEKKEEIGNEETKKNKKRT